MSKLNDFFAWGISSGFFVALVWFLWGYVRPLLETKKQHAKTAQEKEVLGLVETLADTAVASLAGNKVASGSEKFQEAARYVANTLANQGHEVSRDTIDHAVQSAYEKSDLTPTVDPNAKPQTGVVVSHD